MSEGLRSLLEQRPELQVVAVAVHGRACVQLAKEHAPDIIILCLEMPQLNGIDTTRLILADAPESRVMLLSTHPDRNTLLGAVEAGVAGFLVNKCDYNELLHAIDVVLQNQLYLSPAVSEMLVDCFVRGQLPTGPTVFTQLTLREREVLQLIAEGDKTKDIAHRLSVSVKTVEFHRQQVMRKLGLNNVVALTKYAIREGLTSYDE